MRRCLMVLCLVLVVAPWVAAQDPTEVDPDRYQVVFENDQKVQFTMPDGATATMEAKAGESAWIPGGEPQRGVESRP